MGFPDSDGDFLVVMPLSFGFRYLLRFVRILELWAGIYIHGDFVFAHDTIEEHFFGGMAQGGLDIRLGRLVIGADAGYRFGNKGYNMMYVGGRIGVVVTRQDRHVGPRTPRSGELGDEGGDEEEEATEEAEEGEDS